MSFEPTYLISSSIPNAFIIENIQENDVFMSLKNNANKLDIRLNNKDFIFKADQENTKLKYENIDFDVDEIYLNKISTLDNNHLTLDGNVNIINGYLKYYDQNVLVLNENNEIPYKYFSNLNKERINVYDSNVYIDNSLVMINTLNTMKDAAVTIKNNATNSEEITVKLVDKLNNPTIKIYSENPFISIGNNISILDTNIQLAIESNIKCNDIIVNNNSFNEFLDNYYNYIKINDITGLSKLNDSNLEFSNIKVILESDMKNFRLHDDFDFLSMNTISIKNIFCLHLKTFILTKNFILYELIHDNKYYYIDNDIETIKTENNVLIYSKQNKLYYIYNDKTNIINNCTIGGYFNNYQYFIKNNNIIKKHKDETTNEILITTISNINNIYIKNNNEFYFTKSTELYYYVNEFITLLKSNVSNFTLTYDNYIINSSNIFTSSLTSDYYYIINNDLYNHNDSLIESNVLNMNFSDRHIVLLKSDYKIYTKAFLSTSTYDGLGRSYLSILDNTLTNFVGLSIPVNDNVNFSPSVNIGGSLNIFNNDIPNSLCVENCIGVACKPLNNFALRLKGDILIEDGNIYRNTNKSELFDNITVPLTLDDFVKKTNFDFEIDNLTNKIDNVLTSNLLENKNNITILSDLLSSNVNNIIDDIKNVSNIWSREDDIISVNNTRVSINPSGNDDYSVLGGNKVPALFVGNYENIKGLICEDDIAAYSDEKLKTDIKPISNSLQKVLQLNGVNYKKKDDLSKICMGVIAQNVEEQCPEVVYTHNGTKTVAYSNLIALLIEAIKELNEKINNKII